MPVTCPVCNQSVEDGLAGPSTLRACPRCGSVLEGGDSGIALSTPSVGQTAARPPDAMNPKGAPGSEELPAIEGYQVLAVVARGGCGVVLKARHRDLGRLVAIKMILPQYLNAPGARERFLREARSAAGLRHPNICPIYEIHEHLGQPYIAMGFIEGPTLRQWILAQQPSARQAADMVAKLARAVGYAHDRQIIHRDIKPDNVIVDAETRQPILTDFGLAKELTDDDARVTQTGTVMGTPAYMAPEQAAGRADQIGPLTDVYALGAVLYECLCRRPPFQGNVGEIYKKVQTDEPVPPRRIAPRIHRDLETICLKALAKRPEDRYASAAAMAEDLERFSAGESILARRASLADRTLRAVRRRPLTAGALAAAVLMAALGGLLVSREMQSRRVATLRQVLAEGVVSEAWSARDLERMESLVADLARLAPAEAPQARQKLYERLAAHLRSRIALPQLTDEDVAHIDAMIGLLAGRSPRQGETLKAALEDRRQSWKTVFDLRAPFDGLAGRFPQGAVEVSGGKLVRAAGTAGGQEAVLTTAICQGDSQLDAEFQGPWRNWERVGLALQATAAEPGYCFLLVPAPARRATPTTGSAPATGEATMAPAGTSALEIRRNGVLLRQEFMPRARTPTERLRLAVSQEDNRLRFQIDDAPPIVFEDVFALRTSASGAFAVYWPKGAELVSLQARHRQVGRKPSALELGNRLFSEQRYADALQQFQSPTLVEGLEETQLEARYKQASCLLAMNRPEEAQAVLQALASGTGKRWPLRAACQLWRMHLLANRPSQAEEVFQTWINHRYNFADLIALVPRFEQESILKYYWQQQRGIGLLFVTEDRLRQIEHAADIFHVLGRQYIGPNCLDDLSLFRAYWIAGKEDQAYRLGLRLLEGDFGSTWETCAEFAWLARLRGQGAHGLDRLNEMLARTPITEDFWPGELLVERARCRIAAGDWAAAEQDIDAYFQRRASGPTRQGPFSAYSGASLIRGFLHERAGRPAEAEKVWGDCFRQVRLVSTSASAAADDGKYASDGFNSVDVLHALILGSLSGRITTDEGELLFRTSLGTQSGDSMMKVLGPALPTGLVSEALATMWRTDRGRDLARRIAYRNLSFRECVQQPIVLTAYQIFRLRAGADQPLDAAEDALFWDTAEQSVRVYAEQRLGPMDCLAVANTWKAGPLAKMGWGACAGKLEKPLHGRVAYVLGRRYQQLNRPEEAKSFFQEALQLAGDNTVLRRLAQSRLGAEAATTRPASTQAGR
jgi:tetratricopeptide (TPR) repeat protein